LQISNIPQWVTIAYVTGVFVFALWKGGPRERLIAVIVEAFMINGLLDFYPRISGIGVDLVQLGACLACALRSRSYWTIWASAAWVLSVITDIVYLTTPEISRWTYLSASLVWNYALVAALLIGTLARMRLVSRAQGGGPAPWPPGATSRASR